METSDNILLLGLTDAQYLVLPVSVIRKALLCQIKGLSVQYLAYNHGK